jgi:hypothetical protein
MRKLTASVLAAAILTGGAVSGAAFAAPARHSSLDHVASADRSSSKSRDLRSDLLRHESGSRDRASHAREHTELRDQ